MPWAQPQGVKHLHAAVLAASTVCRHWDEEAPWDLREKTAAPGGSRSRSTILPSRGRLKAERGCDGAAAAARLCQASVTIPKLPGTGLPPS